jgi:hypothetical protein
MVRFNKLHTGIFNKIHYCKYIAALVLWHLPSNALTRWLPPSKPLKAGTLAHSFGRRCKTGKLSHGNFQAVLPFREGRLEKLEK